MPVFECSTSIKNANAVIIGLTPYKYDPVSLVKLKLEKGPLNDFAFPLTGIALTLICKKTKTLTVI